MLSWSLSSAASVLLPASDTSTCVVSLNVGVLPPNNSAVIMVAVCVCCVPVAKLE